MACGTGIATSTVVAERVKKLLRKMGLMQMLYNARCQRWLQRRMKPIY
nr:hypothetical protein [Thermosediminibacter oceani]